MSPLLPGQLGAVPITWRRGRHEILRPALSWLGSLLLADEIPKLLLSAIRPADYAAHRGRPVRVLRLPYSLRTATSDVVSWQMKFQSCLFQQFVPRLVRPIR